MPTDINAETVERRTDRLLAEYGDVPVKERTWERSPERFAREVRQAEDGYVGGAYAWVVRRPDEATDLTESMPPEAEDDRKRALMILGRGADRWGLAGGGLEDGETHEEAARREVREETGVECDLTDLFLLRHVTVVSEGDSERRIHFLYAFFDATYEGGSITVQPGELDGAAWFAEPPERLLPANERRAESWSPEVDPDSSE
ncbi:NUDIX domain-containing protein [Halorussus limi]|uniref:NUDIX domain-containing protein n=1 Tax=Halorussus limi TaxID=2938695 RepID=A0A8U0HQQ2_9EURY|nr:NUDIX domain-containing protein [Halorussus limi]UPV73066.1 NUDIX domain-containing protein [Halorussus limi]